MKERSKLVKIMLMMAFVVTGCSTTSNLPDGETLYTGMKSTVYTDSVRSENYASVQEEVEAALACAPNGAILGSSSLRWPWLLGLRIYNKYSVINTPFARWMVNKFGSEPVLMSSVNPEMRSLVAVNILRAHGYFGGTVKPTVYQKSGSRKGKVGYTVSMGSLHRIDTLKYLGFTQGQAALIDSTFDERMVRSGDAFSVSTLDAERTRVSNLFRNNGYYFYRPAYATYMADTVSVPGKVEVHLQPVDGLPEVARHKWYLGRLRVDMRKSAGEVLTDSIVDPVISFHYAGKKPPIRPRALLRDIKIRPRQLYSMSNFQASSNVVNSLGLFTLSDFTLTPRDTAACDTLDMLLNCVFDKPYDVSIEANYALKSNDRTGPGLVLGMTKRNAFRGAEKLSLNLKGSYEWQTGRHVEGNSSKINSYEYGADVSIEYPRIEAPFKLFSHHHFYQPPTTVFSVSGDVLNRAKFFKMVTFTGAVNYKFQTTAYSRHELSPFLLDYTIMTSKTATFDSIMTANPAIYVSMRNQFVPKIKYTYIYTSPAKYKNPIAWETTITEAGNLLSLGYMAAGKNFNKKNKDLFGNPFAQFVKLTSSLRKTWSFGIRHQLVGRVAGGIILAFGNSERAPYSEQFYVGGANSIRAFTIRSIGPGKYVAPTTNYSYLDQTGDIKLEANLEYRFNIFGSLYGATFLDAGNIWLLKKDGSRPDSEFNLSTFFRQLATGTGIGLRYDMDFLVLRLDLGIALHVPYETGKKGYYNIPRFKDGLGLHFAIGYPF